MKFRNSLENFRGLAILFVVLSHFSSFGNLGAGGQSIYFVLTEATSWFVFIAGYLFYHIEGERFQYADYMTKKAKFVILPYFLLSTPAIAAGLYLQQEKLIGLSRAAFVAWSLVVGGAAVGPMWFIPMIVIFYVLSPLFIRLAKSRLIYMLAVLGTVLSLFSFRPLNNLNPFLSFLHFLGFYLLGMVFALCIKKTDQIKAAGKTMVLALPAMVIFILAVCFYEDLPRYHLGFFDGLGYFNMRQLGKLSLLVALFFYFDKYVSQKNRFLAYFAEVSFGLFFIHGFFLVLFSHLSYFYVPPNPLMNFVAEFLVVMGMSLLTVYVLKLVLKNRSRYVIGC
jgi:peptidoglycan/LPS O-acetylase OafA/YrhL